MSNKLKPASRLTIVFILAVVISGSVLAWFSVNNISNLKGLTEKKIIEEQRQLADRFSTEIQSKLNNATSGFENEMVSLKQLKENLFKTVNAYGFFVMPFILDGNGKYLFPNFSANKKETTKTSSRYSLAFQEGEMAEFAEQNLSLARSKYTSCLRYSISETDSVKAINALGRVSIKLKKEEDARQYYKTIIQNYSSVAGSDGFPYVYFTIPQLLKNIKESGKIMPLVEECLEKLALGGILLNHYTDELLSEVKRWKNENNRHDPEYFQRINQLTENIDRQLQFVRKYGNNISYAFTEEEPNRNLNLGNGFEAQTSFAVNNSELLIIKKDFTKKFGFLVDGKKLFKDVLNEELQNGFEFDYVIELSDEYGMTSNNNQLAFASQINPIFPDQYLQIRLLNEDLIDELVKRRSWIYGIASVLLIVAMFLGVFLILRDISREKHMARLRADFISNVTHELKTPLSSIYMFAESLLLKRIKSNKEQDEYLSIITKESERLKRMINNILEFSKMEKGKSDYHFIESNLSETIRATLNDLDYWLEKEDFNVLTELDEKIHIRFDPEKMKQALNNLLNNAIKYSGDSKNIYIRLYENSKGTVIEVEDKGIGMPEEKQQKIFEKFYRIEQKDNISGTGLGLTVVKEIIEAHKGSISVSSKTGKGSKFSIHLNQ